MPQDSREKFGRSRQISIGGGGEGGEGKKREKGYVKAGQSRDSIVCVNGVMHYKA